MSKTGSLSMVLYQTTVWRFNRILWIKHKKKTYTFLNSYLKTLRKGNEINFVKKWAHMYRQRSLLGLKDLFLQIKHSRHLWLRKSLWKSLSVQTVPKTSSMPMVVYQTAVWRFDRILSIKHKKRIYTFLNSYLKRLRKSIEINYVKKNGLIYTVKDCCSTWKIYSCRWSIPVICGCENLSWKSVICGWEKLSWKSLPVQRCPRLVLCRWWCIKRLFEDLIEYFQ